MCYQLLFLFIWITDVLRDWTICTHDKWHSVKSSSLIAESPKISFALLCWEGCYKEQGERCRETNSQADETVPWVLFGCSMQWQECCDADFSKSCPRGYMWVFPAVSVLRLARNQYIPNRKHLHTWPVGSWCMTLFLVVFRANGYALLSVCRQELCECVCVCVCDT